MQYFDIIIIGSGAGGLSAALCLARAGKKVAVIEQHYVPGGWCHSFYIDGHRFSPGVHYIGGLDKGESSRRLYEGLGIANELVFFRMNKNAFEHCWIGDYKIDIPAGVENFAASLALQFPSEKKNIIKYLNLVKKISKQIFLIPQMNGFWDHLTIIFRTRHLGKYALFSLKKVIGWYLKNPLLKKVLNIQCGDHGLPPAKVSFPMHCALMGHYFNGGFYPMGGGAAIVKAMTNAIKIFGGEIYTSQEVKEILLDGKNSKKAIGIQLQNGEKFFADKIISNADPSKTFNLVGKQHLSKKLKKRLASTRYSVSSLIFFITVEGDLSSSGLDSGNIWYTQNNDSDESDHTITKESILEGDKFNSLFISCSSLKDPVSFNGYEHTIEVVIFIDYDFFSKMNAVHAKQDEKYIQMKETLKKKLLNTLEKIMPEVFNNIKQIELGTPVTNEYYINSTKGNVYGTEKGFWQTGPFSYPSKTEIENLYLCGSSIMSHGVAGASYSGVKTAAKILGCREEDLVKENHTQELRIYDAEDSSLWPDWIKEKIAYKKKKFETKLNNQKTNIV